MSRKAIIIALHVSFWFMNFIYDSIFWEIPYNFSQACMAIPFYINYFYLIPHLLKKNKPLYFIGWFVSVWVLMIGTFFYFHVFYHDFIGPSSYSGIEGGGTAKMCAVGAYVSFIYIAISTGSRLLLDWIKNKKIEHYLFLQKTNTQLKLVKSNINFPFILQTLSSIERIALAVPENAQNPVIALSNVLRYGLYDTQVEQIALQKEIDILEDYFSLVNQNETEFSLHFKIAGEIENQKVPPNMLVKFVAHWKDYFSSVLQGQQFILIETRVNEVLIVVSITAENVQFLQSIDEKFILPKHNRFEIDRTEAGTSVQLAIKYL